MNFEPETQDEVEPEDEIAKLLTGLITEIGGHLARGISKDAKCTSELFSGNPPWIQDSRSVTRINV
jgi:hypothetical protein